MRDRGNWRRLLSWHTLTLGMVVLGVGAGAFFLGRNGALSQANARQPMAEPPPQPAPQQQPPSPPMSSAYTRNVVAYIYGTVPITREEFGDYMIARFGAERLEPFINKRIIEYHCNRQGITVTAAEVQADLAETIKNLNVSASVFESKVLKARGKTLYEWKEDVIRPKLMMSKLLATDLYRDRIRVEQDDLQKGYDAYYGEKVRVQMIFWPKEEHQLALKRWDEIRKDSRAFEQVARTQSSAELARVGGMIEPFGRNTTGSPQVEKEAFGVLEIGQISPVIKTDHGCVVIKLLERIPPNKSVTPEEARAKLEKEIVEKKIAMQTPILFAELKKQADPAVLLKKGGETQEQLERDVKKEMEASGTRIPLPEPLNPLIPPPQK